MARCFPTLRARAGGLWILAALAGAAAASGQVAIVDGGGRSLKDLVGTDTLVTVVLKGTNARDANLHIVDAGEDYLSVMQLNGERTAYTFDSVKEIRVQKDKVRIHRVDVSGVGTLSTEDQDVAARAVARALEVFKEVTGDQALRMKAASLMTAAGNPDALAYLKGLVAGNDVPTAIQATLNLYVAGETPDFELIHKGLVSGNRRTKAAAARLAGLTGNSEFNEAVAKLLKDPTEDIFPSAARAAGRLGDPKSIPVLVKNVKALNEKKAEGAVFGLIRMGGDEVWRAMEGILEAGKGMEWFRALKVLYALGDAEAEEVLRTQCLKQPAFALDTAVILGRKGNWEAGQYLRRQLEKPSDPNRENLERRARMAAALAESGYPPAKTTLQKMLRLTETDIFAKGRSGDEAYKRETVEHTRVTVCNLIAAIGKRNLMSLVQPAIESPMPAVALAACEAALSIADSDYRKRLVEAAF